MHPKDLKLLWFQCKTVSVRQFVCVLNWRSHHSWCTNSFASPEVTLITVFCSVVHWHCGVRFHLLPLKLNLQCSIVQLTFVLTRAGVEQSVIFIRTTFLHEERLLHFSSGAVVRRGHHSSSAIHKSQDFAIKAFVSWGRTLPKHTDPFKRQQLDTHPHTHMVQLTLVFES